MISIATPDQTTESRVLASPGGFAWWYADLLDQQGDGLVLIWGFGLPFVPGYASAARRGISVRPVERPVLNVAGYQRGRPALYLLQEYPAESASWSPAAGTWRFGDSVIRSEARHGSHRVRADLDCPVPGAHDRLTGRVEIEGSVRQSAVLPSPTESPHLWSPLLGPARGSAHLEVGDLALVVRGPAYHDRNASSVPLHALGIQRWIWGRTFRNDTLVVWYALWPEGPDPTPRVEVLSIDASGATTYLPDVQLDLHDGRRGWLGMPHWRRGSLLRDGRPWLDLAFAHPIDEGPFYLRQQVVARDETGKASPGWGEVCVPDRIDLGRHRPLVSMAHHRVHRANSWWLPLFSGPRTGRFGRLTRWWLGRDARPAGADAR